MGLASRNRQASTRGLTRPLLWLCLALPGFWILVRRAVDADRYGYGHAVADSGDWAAWLLLLTLSVTPARRLMKGAVTAWLGRHRRSLGVASFAYAAAHTIIYLTDKLSIAAVAAEMVEPELLAGWAALLLFAPLAVTSNDAAVRTLKRRWKSLHRLVHPAAVLVFLHWALTAYDPTTAYLHMGILAVIEFARLFPGRRQSVT